MLAFVIIIDLVKSFGGHTAATDLAFSREENDWKLMAKKMRAVQIPKAKGPLEVVEREIPEPKSGWVRVKVEACGVCHSDSLVKDGLWPGIQYPRIPGHEVIGVIDAVGPDDCSRPESRSMAVMPNTWSHRRKRSRLCRTI